MTKTLNLRKIARIQDLATNSYLERFAFFNSAGQKAVLELAPSTVNDTRVFSNRLRDAGAILPLNKSATKRLLEAIGSSSAKSEFQYAGQPGWSADRLTFVRTNGALGKSHKRLLGFRRSNDADPRGAICLSGSLSDWKRHIAKPARQSTILTFAIAAGFTGPLIALMQKDSFGFCLFSSSRTGKTLATLVAGSVIGIGTKDALPSWNLTDARFQELLSEFNDSLTPIDDLMSMTGSDRDKYARIRSLAYIMATGAGKGRHTSFERVSAKWRSIILTSNEASIRDLASRTRNERELGETIRLIDVPATFEGSPDIFDLSTTLSRPVEHLAWRRSAFSGLFQACRDQQGYVFEEFVRRLLSYGPKLIRDIETYTQRFTAAVQEDTDGPLAQDVASKFGMIYAAARLAIKFELLPWTVEHLNDALQKCYVSARDILPDPGVSLRVGREKLRSYLKNLPRKDQLGKADFKTADGFSQRHTEHYRCLVKQNKFNAIFSSDSQLRAVTEQLIAENRIAISTASKQPKLQHLWPDGQRYRSIEILWPRNKN